MTIENQLDQLSMVLLAAGMVVYALAFVAFALDLARRSAEAQASADARGTTDAARVASVEALTTASADGRVLIAAPPAPPTAGVEEAKPSRGVGRFAVGLTIVALAFHASADLLRGIAADRVPWANLYEFSMTGTLVIVTIFLLSLTRLDLRFLGVVVVGLVLVLLGISTFAFRVAVAPLPPALQSYWLVIHVFVAILATGFFTLGGVLSAVQLVQERRERRLAAGGESRLPFLATIPPSSQLEITAYRVITVGFILWTFTLIAGAIWASHAWNRYWGWDTKEVWTFIIWTIFAGYIHARATRGWRGGRSAWLALIGYGAVLFNFGVVNTVFKGLHAYSGLPHS